MYCAKCGSQNSDQSMYCIKCGAPLRQNSGKPQPGPRAAASMPSMAGPSSMAGNLTEALRGLIASPLYLVAAIALTVQIVAVVIGAGTGNSLLTMYINQLLNSELGYELGYYMDPNQLNALLNTINGANILGTIFANIPSILIVAGLWIQYAQARNPMQRMTTTGFTMIRVIVIIQFVLCALGFAITVIGSLVALIALSSEIENVAVIILILLILFAAIGYLTFSYYLKVIKMLGSACDIIVTGRKTAPAYMYVIVLTFIAAGFQCLSAIGVIFTAGIFGFLSTAAAATSGIAFGLLMVRYNSLETAPARAAVPRQVNVSLNVQAQAPYNAQMGAQGQKGFTVGAPMGSSPVATPAAPPVGPSVGSPTVPPTGTPTVPPMSSPVQQAAPGQSSPSNSNSPFGAPPVIPPYIPPKPGTVVMEFDKEEELRRKYANEGTMVLNDDRIVMPPAKLVRMFDLREVPITKPEFTIGKSYGSVDYFIEDNPAISRKHAMIVLNDGKFSIVDTRSTNHVFVDGQIIPVDTPVPLKDGMKIRLADEVYTFKEG